MKKLLITLLVFALLFSLVWCCTTGYIYSGVKNINKYEADYIYDSNNKNEVGIYYNSEKYYLWSDVADRYIASGAIYSEDMFPYYKVDIEDPMDDETIYIRSNNIIDCIFEENYFCFFSETYDYNRNFIIENPDWLRNIYIKDGFVFPTIYDNNVDEIWLSLSNTYDVIKDSTIVKKIVESAKNESEIDKEIYDYINQTSWDNRCIYFKYNGYPLVEEFYVTETENGTYIIKQFTVQEYDEMY